MQLWSKHGLGLNSWKLLNQMRDTVSENILSSYVNRRTENFPFWRLLQHHKKVWVSEVHYLLVVSVISLQFSPQLWNMTMSSFSSKYFLSWEELSNSTNSLSYSNNMHSQPPLQPKVWAGLPKRAQKSQGRATTDPVNCLFISKERGLQGRNHAAETALLWSVALPERCMLGGKWPPTTCQMLEKFQRGPFGLQPVNTGGFCSPYSKTEAGETDKVINFGVLELVWQ